MPLYDYEIALGFDPVGGFVNFETYFPTDSLPRGQRVPLGALTRKTLSGLERTDGEQVVILRFSHIRFDEFEDYITAIFGDFDTQNVEVTLGTRKRDGTFAYFNAIAHLPQDVTDYVHRTTQSVLAVQMRFTIVEAL